MIESLKTLKLDQTISKLNEAKNQKISFKSNPNNTLERTPETDKVEDKKGLSKGAKWTIGLGVATLATLAIYALTKGKSKPKNNPTPTPTPNPPTNGQKNPVEEIKEMAIDAFKKAGKFDKGQAILADGTKYTGNITSECKDGSKVVMEYVDGVLKKSTKTKAGRNIFERSYKVNSSGERIVRISKEGYNKEFNITKKNNEVKLNQAQLKTFLEREERFKSNELEEKLSEIKYKSKKQKENIAKLIETKKLNEIAIEKKEQELIDSYRHRIITWDDFIANGGEFKNRKASFHPDRDFVNRDEYFYGKYDKNFTGSVIKTLSDGSTVRLNFNEGELYSSLKKDIFGDKVFLKLYNEGPHQVNIDGKTVDLHSKGKNALKKINDEKYAKELALIKSKEDYSDFWNKALKRNERAGLEKLEKENPEMAKELLKERRIANKNVSRLKRTKTGSVDEWSNDQYVEVKSKNGTSSVRKIYTFNSGKKELVGETFVDKNGTSTYITAEQKAVVPELKKEYGDEVFTYKLSTTKDKDNITETFKVKVKDKKGKFKDNFRRTKYDTKKHSEEFDFYYEEKNVTKLKDGNSLTEYFNDDSLGRYQEVLQVTRDKKGNVLKKERIILDGNDIGGNPPNGSDGRPAKPILVLLQEFSANRKGREYLDAPELEVFIQRFLLNGKISFEDLESCIKSLIKRNPDRAKSFVKILTTMYPQEKESILEVYEKALLSVKNAIKQAAKQKEREKIRIYA